MVLQRTNNSLHINSAHVRYEILEAIVKCQRFEVISFVHPEGEGRKLS
jgi:hypothetical protein